MWVEQWGRGYICVIEGYDTWGFHFVKRGSNSLSILKTPLILSWHLFVNVDMTVISRGGSFNVQDGI